MGHLGHSYEDKDFHLSRRRPKDGVSFGMITNTTINKLLDRQNRTMRAEVRMLNREIHKTHIKIFGKRIFFT